MQTVRRAVALCAGELGSRLRDRDCAIEALKVQVNALIGALRKEQATQDLLSRQITAMQSARVTKTNLEEISAINLRRWSPP